MEKKYPSERAEKFVVRFDAPGVREALREVAAFMERERVAFRWEPGDALLIDNATVMHSRDNFSGPRRILASLWGGPLDKPDEAMAEVVEEEAGRAGRLMAAVRSALPLKLSRLRGGGGTGAAVLPTTSALTLRTGAKMPAIGLGLWKLPKDGCAEAVVSAIRNGCESL